MTDGDRALDAYLEHLRAHGVAFGVAAPLHRDADRHGGQPIAERRRDVAIQGVPPFVEHTDPEAGVGADHATLSVAAAMARDGLVTRGSEFWDIGCGSGVLAVAAGLLGAGRVLATDVDPAALSAAALSARGAGIELHLHAGSLLDAVPADAQADLVAANLPHKPRREPAELPLAQDGGPQGDALFGAFVEQAAARLRPGARIVFFQHSLPHPRALARLAESFGLSLRSWKRRYLDPDEYGTLADWFVARSEAGTSYVSEDERGRFLVAGVWLATRR